jgi:phage recombination protein Bet
MTNPQTTTSTGELPKPKLQQAIDTARERGTISKKTTEVISQPEIGSPKAEVSDISVKLPDPDGEKMSKVVELEQPRIVDGQIIFSEKYVNMIKNQVAKDLDNDEFAVFMMQAKRFRLDPFARQFTPIVYNKNNPEKRTVSYITNIDGLRLIAHRTNEYDGVTKPAFTRDKNGQVTHCSIMVYKKGCTHGFEAEVKFSEYTTGKNMWNTQYGKPETMIAKVAEAHALRKAFPQELSGLYTAEEMDASLPKPVTEKVVMIGKAESAQIKLLVEQKQPNMERMKSYVLKTYKVDSVGRLTQKQALHFIEQLKKLPNPAPQQIEESVDQIDDNESFADFVNQETANDMSDMPDFAEQVANDVVNALG